MKKEIADLWVKALRSGDYRQTTETLRSLDPQGGTGFCCLGVLCDVHMRSTSQPESAWVGGAYLLNSGNVHEDVKAWAGMASRNGAFNGSSLAVHNDLDGWTFAQIADHIEKHWEAL